MDNFGFEGDCYDEEEHAGNDKSTDSEEERQIQEIDPLHLIELYKL
jgi:hypothetical protein